MRELITIIIVVTCFLLRCITHRLNSCIDYYYVRSIYDIIWKSVVYNHTYNSENRMKVGVMRELITILL